MVNLLARLKFKLSQASSLTKNITFLVVTGICFKVQNQSESLVDLQRVEVWIAGGLISVSVQDISDGWLLAKGKFE